MFDPCDTADDDGDDVVQAPSPAAPSPPAAPSAAPTPASAATRCLETGGLPTERACCRTAESFPSTCASGGCDCLPEDSKIVAYCECGSVCFDPQFGCVDWQ